MTSGAENDLIEAASAIDRQGARKIPTAQLISSRNLPSTIYR
jgi:hypothetical protein